MSSLISRTLHGVKNDFKAGGEVRIRWWGWLAMCVLIPPAVFLSLSSGHGDIARMVMFSVLAFAWTVAVKWVLRPYTWFWVTIFALGALQVPLIALVSRITEQYAGPSIMVALFGAIDYVAMLVILNFIAQFAKMRDMKEAVGPDCETSFFYAG